MPTTNPVPSQDPSDLLFNAGKLDEVLNGTGTSFTDRLGTARRTVAGMNADFDAQLSDAESDLNVYRADAAASAAEALGYLQTIRATSYGAYASDPATDPLGNPPTVGDEYFNTTSNLLKRWNGATWQASDINTANLAAPSGSSLVGYLPAGAGAVATTVQSRLRLHDSQAVNVSNPKFFGGAKGDGATDDYDAIQAAIDYAGIGGRLIFPQTAANTYCVRQDLKFLAGQTWIGSGGIDIGGGFGTELKLTATSTSVIEPADPAPSPVTYGFTAIGFYFNAQSFADCALSLYNTSYAQIDQCAANAGKDGAAAILLDSHDSKQCYFNKLNQPRTFATGVGGVGIRFTRGANANQVFGGKCGSSHRGMEFLSLSAANVIVGTDFENNSDRHVYIDAPTNKFFGVHMESAPIGFDITANGGNTTRVGTDYASSVIIPVQEAVANDGAVVDIRPEGGGAAGDLRFGAARFSSKKLSGGTTLNYDPLLVSGSSNALVNTFLNTATTGTKQWNIYKGDGTSSLVFSVNCNSNTVTHADVIQGDTAGTYRYTLRRAASPTTDTYNSGDRVVRTNPSAVSPVTEWTCYASGSPGSWIASGWVVLRGPTTSRPALGTKDAGVMYFDTTLAAGGKPIWWTGTIWVDATGVSV